MVIITISIAKIILHFHTLLINQIVNSLSTIDSKKLKRKVAIDYLYDIENQKKLASNSSFKLLRDKIGTRSLFFVGAIVRVVVFL